MFKTHEIVAQINTDLKAVQFASKRFQKGTFSGVAELIKIDDETVPCTVSNNGDCTKLNIDDTKSFQVYHRVIKPEFENNTDNDFGDRKSIKGTENMLMVVIGDRSRLQLTQEDIIAGVAAGWPLTFPKTTLNTLGLKVCDIVPGQFNVDRYSVYNSEFNVKEFVLNTNTILFSFSYQIVTEVDQICFVLCE